MWFGDTKHIIAEQKECNEKSVTLALSARNENDFDNGQTVFCGVGEAPELAFAIETLKENIAESIGIDSEDMDKLAMIYALSKVVDLDDIEQKFSSFMDQLKEVVYQIARLTFY